MSNAPSQDLPPAGGYQPVRFRRQIPTRGPPAYAIGLGLIGAMAYGWYVMLGSIRERRELEREKVWTRFNLVPLLQAELDRDQIRREESLRRLETEVAATLGKEWTDQGVYNTKRYVPRSIYVGKDEWVKST